MHGMVPGGYMPDHRRDAPKSSSVGGTGPWVQQFSSEGQYGGGYNVHFLPPNTSVWAPSHPSDPFAHQHHVRHPMIHGATAPFAATQYQFMPHLRPNMGNSAWTLNNEGHKEQAVSDTRCDDTASKPQGHVFAQATDTERPQMPEHRENRSPMSEMTRGQRIECHPDPSPFSHDRAVPAEQVRLADEGVSAQSQNKASDGRALAHSSLPGGTQSVDFDTTSLEETNTAACAAQLVSEDKIDGASASKPVTSVQIEEETGVATCADVASVDTDSEIIGDGDDDDDERTVELQSNAASDQVLIICRDFSGPKIRVKHEDSSHRSFSSEEIGPAYQDFDQSSEGEADHNTQTLKNGTGVVVDAAEWAQADSVLCAHLRDDVELQSVKSIMPNKSLQEIWERKKYLRLSSSGSSATQLSRIWSDEEDRTLVRLCQSGAEWNQIKNVLPHRKPGGIIARVWKLRRVGLIERDQMPLQCESKDFVQQASTNPPKRQPTWSPEEDQKLSDALVEGETWENIVRRLPGRTLPAIRTRRWQLMQIGSLPAHDPPSEEANMPDPPHERFKSAEETSTPADWTEQEDAILISMRLDQYSWDEIAQKLPGRTKLTCNTRWAGVRYQSHYRQRIRPLMPNPEHRRPITDSSLRKTSGPEDEPAAKRTRTVRRGTSRHTNLPSRAENSQHPTTHAVIGNTMSSHTGNTIDLIATSAPDSNSVSVLTRSKSHLEGHQGALVPYSSIREVEDLGQQTLDQQLEEGDNEIRQLEEQLEKLRKRAQQKARIAALRAQIEQEMANLE